MGAVQDDRTIHVRMGRPRIPVATAQICLLTDMHKIVRWSGHTAKNLRKNYDTSYHTIYHILKKSGAVVFSATKSKKRKWVRFERKYSNAIWHVDWHTYLV